jgi:hypothetical protein
VIESKLVHSDGDRTIAVVDAMVVLVARRPAMPEHVARIDAEIRALAKARPRGVAYVHVVDGRKGESRRVPEETRRAFVELAKNAPPEARCVGVVLLAEGFVAAAMRGVVAAAVAAIRSRVPMKVFSSIDETCAWIEGTLRDADAHVAPAKDLAAAIERLRVTTEGAEAPRA